MGHGSGDTTSVPTQHLVEVLRRCGLPVCHRAGHSRLWRLHGNTARPSTTTFLPFQSMPWRLTSPITPFRVQARNQRLQPFSTSCRRLVCAGRRRWGDALEHEVGVQVFGQGHAARSWWYGSLFSLSISRRALLGDVTGQVHAIEYPAAHETKHR